MPQYLSVVKNSTTIVGSAVNRQLSVTTPTVVKSMQGRLVRVNVLVAGTAVGHAHDAATVGSATNGNKIAVIPNEIGSYLFDVPTLNGVVVIPGSGQQVAVTYA